MLFRSFVNEKEQYKSITKYNATVSGLHNYYQIATNVSLDFTKIAFHIKKQMNNRLDIKTSGTLNKGFIKEKYGKSKQLRFLNGHPLIPVGYIRTKDAKHKKKVVNKYTVKGRAFIHKYLQIDVDTLVWLMKHPVLDKSIEFADNRISLFAALLHPLDLLDGGDAPGLGFFPGMNLDFGRKRAILDLVLHELTSHFTVISMREHAQHIRETTTITKDVGLLARGRRTDMVFPR